MAESIDFVTALENLSNTFGSISFLVVAISQLIGVVLVFRGIAMYKIFATQTMSSAQKGELAGPLVHVVVGVIMIYLGSSIDVSVETLFGSANSSAGDIKAYLPAGTEEKWQALMAVLVKYFKLIGLLAFVKGWIILSKMGHAGVQPGSMGKGLTHIIGGVLLMNMVDTMQLLSCTFGFSTNCG